MAVLKYSAATISGLRLIDGNDVIQLYDAINGRIAAQWLNQVGTAASRQVIFSSWIRKQTENNITASGTTRADAYATSSEINHITTAASGTGVILSGQAVVGTGAQQWMINDAANAVTVYAPGAATINGTAGSTGVSLGAAKTGVYTVYADGNFSFVQLN